MERRGFLGALGALVAAPLAFLKPRYWSIKTEGKPYVDEADCAAYMEKEDILRPYIDKAAASLSKDIDHAYTSGGWLVDSRANNKIHFNYATEYDREKEYIATPEQLSKEMSKALGTKVEYDRARHTFVVTCKTLEPELKLVVRVGGEKLDDILIRRTRDGYIKI